MEAPDVPRVLEHVMDERGGCGGGLGDSWEAALTGDEVRHEGLQAQALKCLSCQDLVDDEGTRSAEHPVGEDVEVNPSPLAQGFRCLEAAQDRAGME
jgi:hypothetical protein